VLCVSVTLSLPPTPGLTGTVYSVSASSLSGAPVNLSMTTPSSSYASFADNTVSFLAQYGHVTLYATVQDDGEYAATTAQQIVMFAQKNTITVGGQQDGPLLPPVLCCRGLLLLTVVLVLCVCVCVVLSVSRSLLALFLVLSFFRIPSATMSIRR
jgi:hypothetical protein